MAEVVMLTSQYTEYGRYHTGDHVDVPLDVANRWQKAGVATLTTSKCQLPASKLTAYRSDGATEPRWYLTWKPDPPKLPSQGWTRGYNWAWLLPARVGVLHG